MQPVASNGGGMWRRPMDLEDYLTVVRRNMGWLLGPVLFGLVVTVVTAFFWPNTYVSVAAIRVVPPQVPERYVPTNVNVQMADRISSMQQTILSRNTLTNIIQTYDLYRGERNRMPMEDIIENMREDIVISGLRSLPSTGGRYGVSAFQIAFSYENRYVAQKVTRDLMTRFIDENIRERSSQSQMTTQFLREQYDQAKSELDAIEHRLTEFRMANLGRLPDQMPGNLQQMSAIESRVSALNGNISRANQEKLMLESELRSLRDKLIVTEKIFTAREPAIGAAVAGRGDEELARLEREVQQLERFLERILEQYQPTYPDVQRLQTRLQAVRKERDSLLDRRLAVQDTPGSPEPAAAPARVQPARLKEISDLEGQIQRAQALIRAKELEIERYIRDITDNDRKLKDVQQRIEAGPIGAQQMEQLTRDWELAKRRYDELKIKVSQSEVATDLENRKQGETLEVLDLPSLPESPTAPNRPVIIIFGTIVGALLGCFIVAVRELKDTSLKTLKDVRAYTQFNVLGSVPLLENDLVVRRRRRIAWLAWSTACLMSVVTVTGSIYYYYSTRL